MSAITPLWWACCCYYSYRLPLLSRTTLHSDIRLINSHPSFSLFSAELAAVLKKNEEDLFNLQSEIQILHSDIHRLGLESEHEEIKQAQAQVGEKTKVIGKVSMPWLPYWMEKKLAHWQGAWISSLKDAWKKAVLLSISGYNKLRENKFLNGLEALVLQIWTYKQRAQKVLEEEVDSAWKFCKGFLSGPVKTFGLQLNRPSFLMQSYLSWLNLYFRKGLTYGISYHLQLQRKVRKLLQSNKHLASKESREVVWFLASALLILPLYGVLLLSSLLR
ncbi:hypothetical protein L7F22_060540 [Adiantum nelumboides]|nr:hypothetical protein [Adiantum nelumboides]